MNLQIDFLFCSHKIKSWYLETSYVNIIKASKELGEVR